MIVNASINVMFDTHASSYIVCRPHSLGLKAAPGGTLSFIVSY